MGFKGISNVNIMLECENNSYIKRYQTLPPGCYTLLSMNVSLCPKEILLLGGSYQLRSFKKVLHHTLNQDELVHVPNSKILKEKSNQQTKIFP